MKPHLKSKPATMHPKPEHSDIPQLSPDMKYKHLRAVFIECVRLKAKSLKKSIAFDVREFSNAFDVRTQYSSPRAYDYITKRFGSLAYVAHSNVLVEYREKLSLVAVKRCPKCGKPM